MPHRFSPGESVAHPPQGRNPQGRGCAAPQIFHRGEAPPPAHRREEIRRGEGVLPRKLFTGGSTAARPSQGRNPAGERDVLPHKLFTGGKRRRPPTAGKKSRRGERAAKKPRRWAGLLNGVVYALPEQPRTSCILWRTSSRMWSRAGVRY